MKLLHIFAAVVLAVPVASNAIDQALCKDDGITEVPPFASGRNANGCLMIDPGNGKAAIPFQYENFHQQGVASCNPKLSTTKKIDVKFEKYGACRTKYDQACTQVLWDIVIDNYLDPGCKNEDVVFMGPPWEYFFMKNVIVANGWACKGGTGWDGPNGLKCAPGEDSEAHSDGMQVRGQPANNGWFVMQDSVFVNGFNLHLLQQTQSKVGPNGSDLFQGVEFGRKQKVGEADTWIDDCMKRQKNSSESDICSVGRANIGTELREAWFVDVFGVTTISLDAVKEKIVVVNTGCGKACDGNISYSRGWPHPISRAGTGPGTCPNGQIGSSPPTFCYRSLEKALADGHAAPPFIRLSDAGWEKEPTPEPDPSPVKHPKPVR